MSDFKVGEKEIPKCIQDIQRLLDAIRKAKSVLLSRKFHPMDDESKTEEAISIMSKAIDEYEKDN